MSAVPLDVKMVRKVAAIHHLSPLNMKMGSLVETPKIMKSNIIGLHFTAQSASALLSNSHDGNQFFNGKAFPGDRTHETKESSLVICFQEMLIDFVPTISGLSLAAAPAFKKAPRDAPPNVAIGIS
ncbi:fructokinase-6 [Spatholobus suberectus]|nr:fructokinase-6 [Spatholobus suberectus]